MVDWRRMSPKLFVSMTIFTRHYFAAHRRLTCSLLLALILMPLHARADSAQLNGSWVLDTARSEDFAAVLKTFNENIKTHYHKNSKHFMDTKAGRSGNQFYSREEESTKEIHEDSRVMLWDVNEELQTLLTAKTIKLYQAHLCALLYDKKIKRLVAINPAGNSYSKSGNASMQDNIGHTLSYFDKDALVIDTDVAGGDRLIERFALEADGSALTVTVKLRRSDVGRTLEFKRVYTRGE